FSLSQSFQNGLQHFQPGYHSTHGTRYTGVMRFHVALNIFRGPLDLLLYLVRKHELDIVDIPIALVTDQFLDHLAVLEKIDVDAVGDFIEMASTLIEIKSRMVLPQGDEVEEAIEDPRHELVERLLAYKAYRDAASILDEQGQAWQQRYPRVADDLPTRRLDPADQPIHEVELWDLVSVFGRVMREHEAVRPSNIVYDETPIETYMKRILARVLADGRAQFSDLFEPGTHKSKLVGVFLAVLELIRHHYVVAEQPSTFAEITILPGPNQEPLDVSRVASYEHGHNMD
ncbi:MAG: segregation/condensation protein A, partial [Pirellulales bacterium]|nr:segregation/condensation protein A [Pirellulales bacterium]